MYSRLYFLSKKIKRNLEPCTHHVFLILSAHDDAIGWDVNNNNARTKYLTLSFYSVLLAHSLTRSNIVSGSSIAILLSRKFLSISSLFKMPGPKILITDPVDNVCANYLKKHGCHVDQIKLTKEQLLENIKVTIFSIKIREFWIVLKNLCGLSFFIVVELRWSDCPFRDKGDSGCAPSCK